MTRDDETTLLVLFGAWLLSQYSSDVVPSIERSGAHAFDVLHNDEGHQQDLPRPERMTDLPPVVKARLAELVELARKVGFPNPELAAAIAMAESGGRADEVRIRAAGEGQRLPEHSIGLWQINVLAHPGYSEEWLLNPEGNAQAAFKISQGGKDWRPWLNTWTKGLYKRYLPKGGE